jgi:hypothetical protein
MIVYSLLLGLSYLLGWLHFTLILMIFLRHQLFLQVSIHLRENVETALDLFSILMNFLRCLLEGLVVGQEISQFRDVFLLFEAE